MEVWHWFIALNQTRASNGFGVSAISYMEMEAYFRLMDIEPELWQIKLLQNFDIIYLKNLAKDK